ncbi:hypothetical protein EGJ05_20335, partial [Stutzerimonas xanthomarina]
FASTPADKAILPTAWGGRYFFNRIGRKQSFTTGCYRAKSYLSCQGNFSTNSVGIRRLTEQPSTRSHQPRSSL